MDESKFYAYCLQGDVKGAYEYLQSTPDKSRKMEILETKYRRRFFSSEPKYRFNTEDAWIRKVLLSYYHYFTRVLTGIEANEAEHQLMIALNKLFQNRQLRIHWIK
jgi:hypothetical protein